MSIKHAAGPVCAVTAIIALLVSGGQVRTNAEGLALIGHAEGVSGRRIVAPPVDSPTALAIPTVSSPAPTRPTRR